jgi:hypothetical protein
MTDALQYLTEQGVEVRTLLAIEDAEIREQLISAYVAGVAGEQYDLTRCFDGRALEVFAGMLRATPALLPYLRRAADTIDPHAADILRLFIDRATQVANLPYQG